MKSTPRLECFFSLISLDCSGMKKFWSGVFLLSVTLFNQAAYAGKGKQQQAKPTPWLWKRTTIKLSGNENLPYLPERYKVFELNKDSLLRVLKPATATFPVTVWLPLPEGQIQPFMQVKASTLSPALENKYPDIRAYKGTDPADQTSIVTLETNSGNITGYMQRTGKELFITPYRLQQRWVYLVYYKNAVKNKSSHLKNNT